MGTTYPEITETLRAFLEGQKVFFVATAPSGATGHVNCSPKGLDTLRVLGPRTIAYLDYTGSGIETIAHLRENGRIVLMFCAFDGAPRIVRLHGRGDVLLPGTPEFAELIPRFQPRLGARSIIRVAVERVGDSCGYAVPRMKFEAERDTLDKWADRKGESGLVQYRREKNARSLDGLPGLDSPDSAAEA